MFINISIQIIELITIYNNTIVRQVILQYILHENMFRYLIFVFFTSTFVEGQRWHTSQTSLMQLYQLQEEHLNLTKEYVELEKTRLGDLKK